MPLDKPGPSSRPRTGAWTRAEARRENQLIAAQPSKQEQVSQPLVRQLRSSARIKARLDRLTGQVNATTNKGSTYPRTAPKCRKSALTEQPKKQLKAATSEKASTTVDEKERARKKESPKTTVQHTAVEDNQQTRPGSVDPNTQVEASPPELDLNVDSFDDMESWTPSGMTPTNTNTTKPRKEGKTTIRKLWNRGVQSKRSEDEWLARYPAVQNSTPPEATKDAMYDIFDTVAKLSEEAKEIIKAPGVPGQRDQVHAPRESYVLLNALRLQIDKAIAHTIKHPLIVPEYYNNMIAVCRVGNEAALQRSVIMNIFHTYWIDSMFDWVAEGQWSQSDKTTRLPTTNQDYLSEPKPDLTISFKYEHFLHEAYGNEMSTANPKFEEVMMPQAPDGVSRCFPFLFIEAKRSSDRLGLEEIFLKNLHTASQAVYNIYLCSRAAGNWDTVRDKVRVFSVVLNAEDFGMRVHRIVETPDDEKLDFAFDHVRELGPYTRESICTTMNAVLEYAKEHLEPLILEIIKALVTPRHKRQAPAEPSPAQKEPRRSPSVETDSASAEDEGEIVEKQPRSVNDKAKRKKGQSSQAVSKRRQKSTRGRSIGPNHTGASMDMERTSISSH